MPKCTQNEVAKIISEMCWASNAEQRATMSQVLYKFKHFTHYAPLYR